jgi:two-component system LytT family response regulator
MTQQTIQPSRPIRCLIVDDEIAAHKNIKYFINQVPGMEFSEGCMNAVKALELVAGQDFDIVFLDVDMPYISGVEFLRIVGRITASVVMTTAHPEFAIDGYDHNVADFLLKPFSLERFLIAVQKVRNLRASKAGHPIYLQQPAQSSDPLHPFQVLQKRSGDDQLLPHPRQLPVFNEKRMWIRVGKLILPIPYKELSMIEASGNYVNIYARGKKHLVRTSMAQLLEGLPDQFIQTHRSYIVNRSLVKTLEGTEIVMSGDKQVAKISRYLRTEVIDKLGPLYG